jgi:RNA polymerase sigma factor (sigma-70 family)
MTISNPLADNFPDHEDQSLVLRARSGDRQALEDLVHRHQAWIYNIAVRMLHHPQDAEDATQEILIKVLTRLASFEGRSSFRTWGHDEIAGLFRRPSSNSVAQTIRRTKAHDAQTLKGLKNQISHK